MVRILRNNKIVTSKIEISHDPEGSRLSYSIDPSSLKR